MLRREGIETMTTLELLRALMEMPMESEVYIHTTYPDRWYLVEGVNVDDCDSNVTIEIS
jgi:hypothetical protein